MNCGFYTDIARWASARGWLRLAFLRLDGRPIAMQFDLEVLSTYYSLKIGYDPAYEHFAPGKLLTYAMVARAVATGAETYELLGKDEEWKYRFTNTFRERFAFAAFPRSPVGSSVGRHLRTDSPSPAASPLPLGFAT